MTNIEPVEKKRGFRKMRILFIIIFVITHLFVIASFIFVAGDKSPEEKEEALIESITKFAVDAETYSAGNGGKFWKNAEAIGEMLPTSVDGYQLKYYSNDSTEEAISKATKYVLLAIPLEPESTKAYYIDETKQIWVANLTEDASKSVAMAKELEYIIFMEEFWLIDGFSRCDTELVSFEKLIN